MPERLHTLVSFDTDIFTLRTGVLAMTELADRQFRGAIEALRRRDLALAADVLAGEREINAMHLSLDEACVRVIARHQPTAVDLREVVGVLHSIGDLERIGDEAKKVARIVANMVETGSPRSYYVGVLAMGHRVRRMLRSALDAFARMDSHAALAVAQEDPEVDKEGEAVMRQLITYMMEDPRTISSSIDLVFVAKAVERVGDHAKNLAEAVIYIVKGADVRHTPMVDIESMAK